MTNQFPNIHKWIMNPDVDNELSNVFWHNPVITYAQKTNILKFRTGQCMSNAKKLLFFGRERSPQ